MKIVFLKLRTNYYSFSLYKEIYQEYKKYIYIFLNIIIHYKVFPIIVKYLVWLLCNVSHL